MSASLTLGSLKDGNLLRELAGPALIIMILAMMILPLPPFALDKIGRAHV